MSTDPASSNSSARWWLARPGQQPSGPHAWEDLVARVRYSGGPGDWLACPEGGTEWKRLADDPSIAAALTPVVPPTPPFAGASSLPPLPGQAPPMPGAFPPAGGQFPAGMPMSVPAGAAIEQQDRNMAMLIHLTALFGFVIPLILWLTSRQRPMLDAVGKEVMNWIILTTIVAIVCIVLLFCYIGFLLLPVVVIASIVFSIIGAVKASNGEFYRYPLPFRLIT